MPHRITPTEFARATNAVAQNPAAHTNPPLADCNPMQAAGYVHDAAAKATGDICAARIKAAEQLPEAEFFRECASARAAQRVILDATEAAWQAIVAAHRPGVL